MKYVGIDDHKIVSVYRKALILDQKLALAVDDKKQFGMGMGMGNGMPVVAVPVVGHLQQIYCSADDERTVTADAVIISAQRIVPPDFIYIDSIPYYLAAFNPRKRDCFEKNGDKRKEYFVGICELYNF